MTAADTLRAFLDDVWNRHHLAAFPDHVHPDVRFHAPRGNAHPYARYLAMATEFQTAFPDLHFEIEALHADGDHANARLRITGTHTGPWRGLAPTGRRVDVIGHPRCRVQDGKIIEFWQLFDELGMLHQLGAVDATLLGTHADPAPPPT